MWLNPAQFTVYFVAPLNPQEKMWLIWKRQFAA